MQQSEHSLLWRTHRPVGAPEGPLAGHPLHERVHRSGDALLVVRHRAMDRVQLMPDFLRQGPPLREEHRPADKAQAVVRVLL